MHGLWGWQVPARTCSRADGAHEVGNDGQGAYAHAAKGSSSGDVAVELLLQGLHSVAVTLQHELRSGAVSAASASYRRSS